MTKVTDEIASPGRGKKAYSLSNSYSHIAYSSSFFFQKKKPFSNSLIFLQLLRAHSVHQSHSMSMQSSYTIQPPAARDETVGQALLDLEKGSERPVPPIHCLEALMLFILIQLQNPLSMLVQRRLTD
uniref:Uncharacterized protein n=1 Tax=Anthurium amnicola TaxID=1678845 RepID=A0A1D1ZC92_9ARAE